MIRVSAISLRDLQLFTPALMHRLARFVNTIQRSRVQSKGRGSSGGLMPLYSREYAKERAKAGRTVSQRDLTFTGRMWAARGVKRAEKTRAVIGWPAGEGSNKARGNEARTPFIQMTPEERERASAFARVELRKHIQSEIARLRAQKGRV